MSSLKAHTSTPLPWNDVQSPDLSPFTADAAATVTQTPGANTQRCGDGSGEFLLALFLFLVSFLFSSFGSCFEGFFLGLNLVGVAHTTEIEMEYRRQWVF